MAMDFSTRVTSLLGIRYPIIQAGMSWASSNAALALAVSKAGGLGVIAAGPMYPDALRAAIKSVKEKTDKPFAVNVPLYNARAATFLDIVLEEKIPILVASQGGPKQHLARFSARRHLAARRRVGRARGESRGRRRRCADRGRRRSRRPSAAGRGRHARAGAASRQGGEACRWSRAAASPTAPASPRCSGSAPKACSSARASW